MPDTAPLKPVPPNDRPISLRVYTPSGIQSLVVASGSSLRDALDTTELRVRAACGGTGSCGACLVYWIGGTVSPLTTAEYQKLLPEERAAGMRLACQMRLLGDAEVRLDDPAPPSCWKSIVPEDLATLTHSLPELTTHIYGVAVDLGTTHIRLSLWDRKHGQRIATRRGPNPQCIFGADVLNRLNAARAGPERARELARLARTAIVQALRDILKRDVGEVMPMLARIGQVVIVGNTAMLALLTGHGGEALLDPANWQRPIDCEPLHPASWQTEWFMPNAIISLPDPVAGFVGSDLLADLVATDLVDGPPGSLLVDIGTNTEIALWDGNALHVTSVPGGPAFEGVGIRFGMPAEPGAICGIRATEAGFRLATIGGVEARGFCGSGLVDAIAILRSTGFIKPSGRFAQSPGEGGHRLDPANPRTAIVGSDADALQRAKAAMAAAMAELLKLADMGWQDLRRLCVCGAFGHTLDIGHAQAIGLLPEIDRGRIELHADATLAGCERALLSSEGASLFRHAGEKIRPVNLSQISSYDDNYINHLHLCPAPPVK